tara:strand:+ start:569 stop:1090 length:522 start_codon:yes stop_codon:yes gene_type:complete
MANRLQFIKSQKVTGEVSSINVDNVFSDAYNVYFVTVSRFSTVGTTQTRLNMRYIDSSGSVESSTTYDCALLRMPDSGGFTEVNKEDEATYHQYCQIDQSPESAALSIFIYNPYDSNTYTFQTWDMTSANVGKAEIEKGCAVEKTTQSYRGFQILEISSRPFNSGKISVYGVK